MCALRELRILRDIAKTRISTVVVRARVLAFEVAFELLSERRIKFEEVHGSKWAPALARWEVSRCRLRA